MNKSMIALAVAGALAASAAAQAETTLYGSARISVLGTQPSVAANNVADKSNWDVANEASRIGVKGSEDLGGGLKAIYQYEFGVNIDGNGTGSANPWNQRLSSVGLTGGFGTVVLGRVWSAPYLYVGSLTDVFNSSASGNSGSMGWDRLNAYAATGQGTMGGGERLGNVVAYITPNFSGFSAAAAVVMDGNGQNAVGNREDIDAYDIAGGYTLGGLTLGASYRDYKALDYTQWTVGAAYKFPFGLRLATTYSSRDQDGKVTDPNTALQINAYDPTVWDFVAEYNFGPHTIRAGYSLMDHDGEKVVKRPTDLAATTWDDTESWRIGYQYDLSKRTRLWVEYNNESDINLLSQSVAPNPSQQLGYQDRSFVSIGMRHDF